MAKNGGIRRGAGRKPGSPNKSTIAQKLTISEAAQSHAAVALKVLVEIAMGGDSEAARVSACNAILDRGFGKAPQTVDLGNKDNEPFKTSSAVDRLAELGKVAIGSLIAEAEFAITEDGGGADELADVHAKDIQGP